MRVYLLNPPYHQHFSRSMRWQETARGGTLYYPIWLAYATGLIEERHNAKLVDAPARGLTHDDVIEDIISYNPDLLVVDSSYTSWRNDLQVAADAKQAMPNAFTVIVGAPTSTYSLNYLRSPLVDAVVQGEYELPLKELVDALEKGDGLEGISGLSWKDAGKIRQNSPREPTSSLDLEKVPWVSKTYKKHLDINDYFMSLALYPEVQIVATRGCPHLCTFCEWPQIFTMHKYRSRSVENVIGEMSWIRENLPEVKDIVFEDDTFSINRIWLHEFCDKIITNDLEFTWTAQIRADVDFKLLRKMRNAGCRLIVVGFESGSDKVLKMMKKGITVDQSRSFAKAAKKAGIITHGDFIIGMPGETKETIEETRALINEIKPEILQVSVATPFPGTEFYEYVRNNGYLLTQDPADYLDKEGHQVAVVNYPGLTADEMDRSVDRILKDYYLSATYVPLALRQIIRRGGVDEIRRIIHAARVYLKYSSRESGRLPPLSKQSQGTVQSGEHLPLVGQTA